MNKTPVIMGMPRRYIQGSGAISQLGDIIAPLAGEVALVADDFVHTTLGDPIQNSLSAASVTCRRLPFQGECTEAEIARLAEMSSGVGAVLAAGGGKAIDTAKGVAVALGCEIVACPTIASNDSPTSRLIVVYSEDHVLENARHMNSNPAAVVVDTNVIISAPRRFLLAGIGDAMSKVFEAGQSSLSGANNFFDGRPPRTALAIASECYQILRDDAETALAAHASGKPDDAFERLVEAAILMSGLAFENGGLSIAHAVLRGFSADPDFSTSLHGEQVAVGLLVQLLTDPRNTDTAAELVTFYRKLGLPTTLAAIGAKRPVEDIAHDIAAHTLATAPYVHNIDVVLDQEKLAQAIIAADRLGTSVTS